MPWSCSSVCHLRMCQSVRVSRVEKLAYAYCDSFPFSLFFTPRPAIVSALRRLLPPPAQLGEPIPLSPYPARQAIRQGQNKGLESLNRNFCSPWHPASPDKSNQKGTILFTCPTCTISGGCRPSPKNMGPLFLSYPLYAFPRRWASSPRDLGGCIYAFTR